MSLFTRKTNTQHHLYKTEVQDNYKKRQLEKKTSTCRNNELCSRTHSKEVMEQLLIYRDQNQNQQKLEPKKSLKRK